MLPLRLDHYENDLRQIVLRVTDGNNAEHRHCRAGSYDIHEIEVSYRDDRVVCILQERDLYLVGIKNAHGVFYFRDARPPGTAGDAISLPIGCSYTNPLGLAILTDPAKRDTKHSFNSVWAAVNSLQSLDGHVDEPHKVQLGVLCYIISEAMRFKMVFEIIKGVLTPPYTMPPFTFAECEDFVQNWKKISGPGATADQKQYLWTSAGP